MNASLKLLIISPFEIIESPENPKIIMKEIEFFFRSITSFLKKRINDLYVKKNYRGKVK